MISQKNHPICKLDDRGNFEPIRLDFFGQINYYFNSNGVDSHLIG